MPAQPHILVADDVASFAVFRDALSTPHRLVHAARFEEAKAALLDEPALVVCGCHFDEGHIYDLLRYLKALPSGTNVPFLALRCVEGELLDDALYESVKIAVRALGGNAFVDLLRWRTRWGEAEASLRLTRLVETLLQAPPGDTTFS